MQQHICEQFWIPWIVEIAADGEMQLMCRCGHSLRLAQGCLREFTQVERFRREDMIAFAMDDHHLVDQAIQMADLGADFVEVFFLFRAFEFAIVAFQQKGRGIDDRQWIAETVGDHRDEAAGHLIKLALLGFM